MPEVLSPGIGTVLSVSLAVPATEDATAYAALTWVDVGEITEVPEHGAQSEVISHTPLATGITRKFHGAINMGSLTIPAGFAPSDPGQAILRDARRDRRQISVRLVYPKVDPDSVTGFTEYVLAKVFSATLGASTSAVNSGSYQVEFDSEIVEVDEL